MQRNSPADSSLLNLPDIESLARETGFLIRESFRMTPSTFLQTMLSTVCSGKASLNQIAMALSERAGRAISKQGVHQRLSTESTAFLTSVVHGLLAKRFSAPSITRGLASIRRILIEDSSVQTMLKSNAETFPAHGNRHGSTAGAKIDFAYDLISGEVISHSLHRATEQDKTIGKELIATIEKNDLVLRDMGYFSVPEFVEIERREAFWLTRVPANLGLVTEEGRTLEALLRSHSGTIIDTVVMAGAEGKLCRLVAVRAAGRVSRQRRKQRRTEAEKNGGKADPDTLLRDGWHLMITNLPAEEFSPEKLRAIYRARWGVEIQFRAWKQAHNLDEALARKSGEHHIMAILLAAMINHLLGMRIARVLRENRSVGDLSYEKLYDALSIHHPAARRWEDILTFEPIRKHIEREKRKRKSPVTARAVGLA